MKHSVRKTAPFIALALWVFLVFWKGRVAIPTEDQWLVMWERVFHSSDFSFFKDMLSFNRTRLMKAGDVYLFRPGTHAVIALQDIFLRTDFVGTGLFSIGLLAATAGAIFHWLRQITSARWAFLLTLSLVTPFAASKIVLWSHISAYLLCPLFLSLGMARLEQKRLRTAGIFFFLSCLFHESAVLALGLWGLTLAFFSKDKKEKVRSVLIPVVFFLIWGVGDYLFHQGLHSPFSYAADSFSFSFSTLTQFFQFLGVALVAHFSPTSVTFRKLADDTLYWDFSTVSLTLALALGIGFVVFWGWLAAQQKNKASNHILFLSLFLLVVTVALVVGRKSTRGWEYLYRSTYYFFFTSWAFTGLLASATSFLKPIPWARGTLAGLLVWVTLSSVSRLHSFLVPEYERKREMASLVKEIDNALKEHSQWCYAGSSHPSLHSLDPLLFYRKRCKGDGKLPVTASWENRHLTFFKLENVSGKTPALQWEERLGHKIGLTAPMKAEAVYFKDRSAALFHDEKKNYSILFLQENRLYQLQGDRSQRLIGRITDLSPGGISLRAKNQEVLVFWGDSVVGTLAGEKELAGRFGIWCEKPDECSEKIAVSTSAEPFAPLLSKPLMIVREPAPLKPLNY